jgi:hypothetical protein
MRKVKQTKFHTKKAKGNCMAAAFASILNLPLESIPQFEKMARDEWQESLFRWLHRIGYDMEVWHEDESPKGYAIANGPSSRGVGHSVIYKDGKLAHDPHPSGDGLVRVEYFWIVYRLSKKERVQAMVDDARARLADVVYAMDRRICKAEIQDELGCINADLKEAIELI